MKKNIANWGNFPVVSSEEKEISNFREIQKYIQETPEFIPRGNARCYGDAALHENTFSTKRLNKFLSFDREKGILECESGVLLSDILDICVPAGFFLPVTPGTKLITVGGAIAADVHGKNHHVDGCFSEHVDFFTLMNAQGELLTCSRQENTNLFWATIGGMGLTGIIISAKFTLKPIESAYIKQESIKANNLDEIMDLFEASESWTYTVAWFDCLQKGKNIGRSIMMRGEHAKIAELPEKLRKNPLQAKPKLKLNVPFQFPSFVLNSLSIAIFNFLFYNKQQKKQLDNIIDYDTFFYPLDAINNWNRIYGKQGFIQYQFVIPKENGKDGMRQILDAIAQSGQGSFLGVLKLFGKSIPQAYNSFPFEGYTMALDFKVNKNLPQLVVQLDALVSQFGGRIYRAKDSMSKSSLTDYLKNTASPKFNSTQNKRINNSI